MLNRLSTYVIALFALSWIFAVNLFYGFPLAAERGTSVNESAISVQPSTQVQSSFKSDRHQVQRLKQNGESCTRNAECASNICFFSDNVYRCGYPNKPNGASCSQAQECASNVCFFSDGVYRCGYPNKPNGASCIQSQECASNICVFSDNAYRCVYPNKPNGASCTQALECASLNCVNNVCQ